MADNSGVRVHVTRIITYSYDEHFFERDSIKDIEDTLADTVSFRDRGQCHDYGSTVVVNFTEIKPR